MDNLPISISSKAILQLNKVKKVHNSSSVPFVRIGIKGGGGCAGAVNFIALDEKTDKDIVYREKDIDFVIEKGHLMYLVGMQIDYIENDLEKGFVFETT